MPQYGTDGEEQSRNKDFYGGLLPRLDACLR